MQPAVLSPTAEPAPGWLRDALARRVRPVQPINGKAVRLLRGTREGTTQSLVPKD
jgi:hypothetical protein